LTSVVGLPFTKPDVIREGGFTADSARGGPPDGQVSQMAGREHYCGKAGLGRLWHPIDLPESYHTAARRQSRTTHAPL
jgi:hypothetical protein